MGYGVTAQVPCPPPPPPYHFDLARTLLFWQWFGEMMQH